MILKLYVQGEAQPQGSKTCTCKNNVAVMYEANPKTKPWRTILSTQMAIAAARNNLQPLDVPVRLDVVIQVARPKAHFNSKGFVKPNAPVIPGTGYDTDKVLRCIYDAGTGIWWTDDRRISCPMVRRRYARVPGLWLMLDTDELEEWEGTG